MEFHRVSLKNAQNGIYDSVFFCVFVFLLVVKRNVSKRFYVWNKIGYKTIKIHLNQHGEGAHSRRSRTHKRTHFNDMQSDSFAFSFLITSRMGAWFMTELQLTAMMKIHLDWFAFISSNHDTRMSDAHTVRINNLDITMVLKITFFVNSNSNKKLFSFLRSQNK